MLFNLPKRILLVSIISIIIFSSVSAQINFSTQSSYNYLKGIDAISLQSDWFEPAFDDSGWNTGNAPFRYGDGSGGTELTDMQGSYSTVFLRSKITVQNLDKLGRINIAVNWDDGFALWINGVETLSQQSPSSYTFDAIATGSHESGTATTFSFDASELELSEGENSLAVLVCNISLDGSSDFYFDMNIFAQAELPELVDTLGLSFSHASGFYSDAFLLDISSPVNGADIVYTLDGSNPQNSASRIVYDPAVKINIDPDDNGNRTLTPAVVVRASIMKDGLLPSKPTARTYIYLQNVKAQTHPGGNWPAANLGGSSQYLYYDMDPDVVNSSEYADQIETALRDIPSFSIITDNANLFDPGYGIYVNADQHGYEWERECSVELIQPDRSTGFNVNAGMRIRGGWSRHNNYPKHAFRLYFREQYGNAKLNYPLFEDEGVSVFDKIDLRCAQNYSWANGASKYNTFVREVFARDAQKDSGQPYTRSRYYHLYVNGLYWGLYQTQERAEARFAADYFGGNSDDYDVIKPNGIDYLRNVIATDGTIDKWKEILDLTQAGYVSNEDYFKMEGRDANGNAKLGGEVYVEIDNLIDYMMNIFFTGNYDSPTGGWSNNKHANNFFAAGNREKKSEGFRFFIHDAEHSLMNEASAGPGIGLYENRADIGDRSGSYRMNVSSISDFHPQWLHYKLSKNEEYRVRFANRAWNQLTGNGIFTQDQNTERFNKRADQIDMAIIAESARWGGARTSTAKTKADWLNELDVVRNKYFPYRTNIVIGQLEDLDLFPTVKAPHVKDAEEKSLESEVFIAASTDITITNPQGSGDLYYTIDGSDPRIVGGEVNENAIRISSGKTLAISSSMVLKTRIVINNKWSASNEITFIADQTDYSHFKVTEINYHPRISIVGADTTFDEVYEFIEFKNTSMTEGLNLTGLVIDSAVYYEFPENYILAPDQYYVVASKPGYFFERYGTHPSGNYQRNFSNAGERVIVRKLPGDDIIDFTYDDAAPWPEYADGIGASMSSLELNPEGEPSDFAYWTSSIVLHGTPFAADSMPNIAEFLEFKEMRSVQLYPNPSHDLLMVQTSPEADYRSTIKIYDIRGALYFEKEFENYLEISLNDLNMSSGIILVEIVSPMGKETQKVIYNPR
jgi:hypothetical protein